MPDAPLPELAFPFPALVPQPELLFKPNCRHHPQNEVVSLGRVTAHDLEFTIGVSFGSSPCPVKLLGYKVA
ncbi:hypothetical protein [Rhizobium tubonense]|uniref:Uncharacterized protein n=1 Tax=Rhizobium tubonense TaxID=484088 RepID=A0A2W4EW39_9HYPH|nr:hypothetical protein [Rhizobium tubonense]PZM14380.1 hypothetical protein CPY51_11420 [Rhizobium tubonense]